MQKSLTELRRTQNITQSGLAKAIGVSQQAVSHWEKGIRTPKLGVINKIANVLEVEPAQVLDCFN